MSFYNSPALVLELPPSNERTIRIFFLSILVMVVLILALNGLMQGIFAFSSLACFLTVIFLTTCLWVTGCRSSPVRVKTITWQQDGTWVLSLSDGQHLHATLSKQSWITSWVWCLFFHTKDQQVSRVLLWRGWFPHTNWQLWLTRLHLQAVHNANSISQIT